MNTRCRPFTFAVLFLLAMLAVFAYHSEIRKHIGADGVMSRLIQSARGERVPHPVEDIIP